MHLFETSARALEGLKQWRVGGSVEGHSMHSDVFSGNQPSLIPEEDLETRCIVKKFKKRSTVMSASLSPVAIVVACREHQHPLLMPF